MASDRTRIREDTPAANGQAEEPGSARALDQRTSDGRAVPAASAAALPEITPDQLERLRQDEAEQIVLGEAMADPRGAEKVAASVASDDFVRQTHKRIFQCICAVYERHGMAPPPAVLAELRERYPDAAAQCGLDYLEALIALAPGYGFPEAYIAALKRATLRRKLLELAEKLQRAALSRERPEQAVQQALEAIATLQTHSGLPAPLCPAAATAEEIAQTSWVWERWLPRGHITILAGQPGVGKSALALEMCRRALLGLEWPDGTPAQEAVEKAAYCDSEGAQAINVERMRRWGVPMGDVLLWGPGGLGRMQLTDPEAVASMYNAVRAHNIGLVVIDSLRAALGPGLDENDSRVAAVLTPWAELARDTGTALVIVHHFRKTKETEGSRASVERLRGSGAIAAVARLIVAIDKPAPEGKAVRVSVIKSNLGPLPEPLGMVIGEEGLEFTAEAPAPPRRDSAVARAEEFLRAQLQQRPMCFGELQRLAAERGISKNSLYRARQKMGLVVVPDKRDPRRRLWSLSARE